jgi:ABC-type sugar transport system ATPase subunit
MEPLLRATNLTKRFGGLTAVNSANLEVHSGEVVGLVGDNGAGKSTLIKMVSGVYLPDGGQIEFDGKPMVMQDPREARAIGIETIYQDLALAENLDVSANIFLGREVRKPFLGNMVQILDRRVMSRESATVLDRLDIQIPSLAQQTRNLSGGQRQAVAIARAVYWNARLMIMDEPTAALGVPEQRKVLTLVRTLRDQGVPTIIISHNMQDVFAVADRIVIMRRGFIVGERKAAETTVDEIVSLMVGAEVVHQAGVLPKALEND